MDIIPERMTMQIILNTEYFLVVLNLQGGLNIKLIESGSVNEIARFGKLIFGKLYILVASTPPRAGLKQNTFWPKSNFKSRLKLERKPLF